MVHFDEYGSGEPLVLLHGNGGSSEYFERQIPFFEQKYRVIAVDSRGHGKSERGDGELTLSRIADDLLEVLDFLKIEKASLLGFSDGGNIALIFAIKYPERVKCIIANGANTEPSGATFGANFYAYRTLFFSYFKKDGEKTRELMRLMINEPHIGAEELKSIEAPTLVIAGDRDMIKTEHTKYIARHLKNAELCIFRDGTHFIAWERADEFNEKVHEFLQKNLK